MDFWKKNMDKHPLAGKRMTVKEMQALPRKECDYCRFELYVSNFGEPHLVKSGKMICEDCHIEWYRNDTIHESDDD